MHELIPLGYFSKIKTFEEFFKLSKYKSLYVDAVLKEDAVVSFDKDFSKRLARVLRMKEGDSISLFNGVDGLFLATLQDDKCASARVLTQLKPLDENLPKVTLMVACVKKNAFDLIFRQATEMGVTYIQPLQTDFTVVDKLNAERVRLLLIEAAEQCGRLSVPVLLPVRKLVDAVSDFGQSGQNIFHAAEQIGGKWGDSQPKNGDALLIGPEGGFSDKERIFLEKQAHVMPVGLGSHILRADTAVVAGLSRFYQALV